MPKPYRENDEAKSRRRRARGNSEPVDWINVDHNAILKAVAAVSNAGGAIRFGYTQGQGAYAIGYLGDGEPYTDYVRPSDDINGYLEEIARIWSTEDKPVTLHK